MKQRIKQACLVTLLFATGCSDTDFRPEAVGKEGRITVVIDSALWRSEAGATLREQIESIIPTLPSHEPAFELEPLHLVNQDALEMARTSKNVIFIAAIADTTTNESRFIRNMFSPELTQSIIEGEGATVSRSDVWRRRQLVYYIAAGTPEKLVDVINSHRDAILHQFNEVTRQRKYREMFEFGRQPSIEADLMANHGFAVHAQHDFVVAIDTSQFVWMRRSLSDTWRSVFVHYEDDADPSMLTPEWMVRARDHLTRRYIQGTAGGWIEVDQRRPLFAKDIEFKDRNAIELRGLWHMVGEEDGKMFPFGMGGPFLTYAFYDEPSRRVYLMDGMVFAPNFPKREFLRQLEVIAYTFRTSGDMAES